MNPKLTDDAVAGLPLHHARADLLEEIMRTSTLDDRPAPKTTTPPPARSRWLAPIAAAAAVGVLAGGIAWWGSGDGSTPAAPAGQSEAAEQEQVGASSYGVILDAPGWRVAYASIDSTGSELSYENGAQSFEASRYPADSYDSYVEDRRHIVDPPADGTPVEVLGLGGQMWAYSADDHTVIREKEGGSWLEFRGTGMDEAAFLALLDRLRAVDQQTFEAALPEEFVTSAETSAAIDEMLAGIEAEAGVLWPMGTVTAMSSDEVDPYQLGADVSGTVACAWLSAYVDARAAGDQDGIDEAARVLGTSRQWPVLQQMDAEGDYPEAVWGYADQVVAGDLPEGYEGGLGCAG